MSYRIEFTARAAKEFERLTPLVQNRVGRKVQFLGENPFSPGTLKLAGGYEGH